MLFSRGAQGKPWMAKFLRVLVTEETIVKKYVFVHVFFTILFALNWAYSETFVIDTSGAPLSITFEDETDTLYSGMESVPDGFKKRGFTLDDALSMLSNGRASIVNFDYDRSEYIAITIDHEIKDDAYYLAMYPEEFLSDIELLDKMSVVNSGIGFFARRYVRILSLNRYQVLYARRLNENELLLINCVNMFSQIDQNGISYFDDIMKTISYLKN